MSEDYYGQQHLTSDDEGGFNTLSFVFQQLLGKLNTATLVQVASAEAVGVAPVGFVDVIPLVHQQTGDDLSIEHGTIYGVPYLRIQGGKNAVIVDPKKGDIGYCLFADHDISSVKRARGAANPGSRRKFDFADALYIGGWSKVIPENYVIITDGEVKVIATSKVTVTAPDVEVNGDTKITGTLHVTGKITADSDIAATGDVTAGAVSLKNHIHTGGTISGYTGTPVP